MSTPRTFTQTARLISRSKPRPNHLHIHQTRRTFLTSTPQTLTAARRLPYNHERLYDLIADIDSYKRFLPYCKISRITHWTPPTPSQSTHFHNRRWPTRADLTAGWGGFEETYTSRVFCVPSSGIVEAISGNAYSEIPAAELRQHSLTDPGPLSSSQPNNGVFESLVTRWTVLPATEATRADRFQHDWSDVRLSIKYQFANPLYMAVSAAVADKVAPVMVEAFVEQARRILGETGKDVEILR
ncbi:uncharacterized protein F4822DRAFT_395853 [Hypoxylon trugodes]|uniref:uncharacterized protein n=1 Tax=Hypoxylon trugodes TaxID=326681 RepID=UPI00218F5BE2|nr:uncharacterized protein F4822DRAFT_395853 [Hypoxylon trugodes]KAI1391176.1 hypothetical protein F4822DRAFT_395853 [Hypoxylon trugodes]